MWLTQHQPSSFFVIHGGFLTAGFAIGFSRVSGAVVIWVTIFNAPCEAESDEEKETAQALEDVLGFVHGGTP